LALQAQNLRFLVFHLLLAISSVALNLYVLCYFYDKIRDPLIVGIQAFLLLLYEEAYLAWTSSLLDPAQRIQKLELISQRNVPRLPIERCLFG